MNTPLPLKVFEVLESRTKNPREIREAVDVVVAQLPAAGADVYRLLGDFLNLFTTYLREGDIAALRPHMKRQCVQALELGLSMENFVRILMGISAQGKRQLVEELRGDPEDLSTAFIWLDQYDYALFDAFAVAQAEYWERREREAEKLHEEFFNRTPFPAFTGSSDLIIRDRNDAARSGLPDPIGGELIGVRLDDWLRAISGNPGQVAALMEKLHARGRLLEEEIEIRCPETRDELFILLTVNIVTDLSGRPRGFQAIVQDISARKRLEFQLSQYLARMDAVFDSTPVGLVFVGPNRVIQRINDGAARLLGYPPPSEIQMSGRTEFREEARKNFKNPAAYGKLLEEVYSDPEARRSEVVELINPHRLVWYSVSPVAGESAASLGWLWILMDVTEKARNDALKNDLTHMIVHDLKNPLTAIRGATFVLKSMFGGAEPKAADILDLTERNARRMLGMIMNLLDIEKLQSGSMELDLSSVRLAELIDLVIRDQSTALGARHVRIEIEEGPAREARDLDSALIERVLTNLISNAVKHTRPTGHIRIRARADATGRLDLRVEDDGAGIPGEFHKKIFEKFGQAELRKDGHKTDTGLGLTFCKLAVEAHGGAIRVESEPGRGAVFVIELPREVRKGKAPAAAAPNAPAAPAAPASDSSPPSRSPVSSATAG